MACKKKQTVRRCLPTKISSVSSDSIVKGIIDDIINTAVKTAEVDEQKTKYLQHFINKHDTIVSN